MLLTRQSSGLVVVTTYRAAHLLDSAAMPFCLKLPFFGCTGGLCFNAGFGSFSGFAHKSHETIQSILPIPVLGTKPFGLNDKHPVVSDFSTSQGDQTGTNVIWQTGGMLHIKAKLNRRGHFVDILPSRSRGPDEIKGDLIFINGNQWGNRNHRHRFW